MVILNLTQHPASAEQKSAGVVDLTGQNLEDLRNLLNFNTKPSISELEERASSLVTLIERVRFLDDDGLHEDGTVIYVMIGGAPYLMSHLESAITDSDRIFLYSFSKRVSVEETQPDGSVIKTNVFKHVDFISSN